MLVCHGLVNVLSSVVSCMPYRSVICGDENDEYNFICLPFRGAFVIPQSFASDAHENADADARGSYL